MTRSRYNISQYLPKLDTGGVPSGVAQIYSFLANIASHIDQIIDRDIKDIEETQSAISDQMTETLETTKEMLKRNEEIIREAISDEIYGLDEKLRNEYVRNVDMLSPGPVQIIAAAAKKKPLLFGLSIAAIVVLIPLAHDIAMEIIVGFFRKTFDINLRELIPWLFTN